MSEFSRSCSCSIPATHTTREGFHLRPQDPRRWAQKEVRSLRPDLVAEYERTKEISDELLKLGASLLEQAASSEGVPEAYERCPEAHKKAAREIKEDQDRSSLAASIRIIRDQQKGQWIPDVVKPEEEDASNP